MEWISVKDKLPKINIYVLVYASDFHSSMKKTYCDDSIRIANLDEYDEWQDLDDDYWGCKMNVTHWMPLPEPPQDLTRETPKNAGSAKQGDEGE